MTRELLAPEAGDSHVPWWVIIGEQGHRRLDCASPRLGGRPMQGWESAASHDLRGECAEAHLRGLPTGRRPRTVQAAQDGRCLEGGQRRTGPVVRALVVAATGPSGEGPDRVCRVAHLAGGPAALRNGQKRSPLLEPSLAPSRCNTALEPNAPPVAETGPVQLERAATTFAGEDHECVSGRTLGTDTGRTQVRY